MNPILQVKLTYKTEGNTRKPNEKQLRANSEVTVEKISALIESLQSVLRYYRNTPRLLSKILIDVNYNDIIAKSKRIQEVLKPSRLSPNDAVVGARFSEAPKGQENHIITYYVSKATIEETIVNLLSAKDFVACELEGRAKPDNFNGQGNHLKYQGYGLVKSRMRGIIVDCSVIDSFSVPSITSVPEKESFLITFYKTELKLSQLFERLKIDEFQYPYFFCGNDTVSGSRELYEILNEKVPYMISMISSDFSLIKPEDVNVFPQKIDIEIPSPSNEPVIGVIDTLFDTSVYFGKWVESIDYLDAVEKSSDTNANREHGVQVTSIIVDGPRLNPWLDDGCGRFRVRHFGVCAERIQPVRLIRKIREIVNSNLDIHVWNLSLGTEDEVSRNFISYDAAALDEIQTQHNVLFVISGTNDNRINSPDIMRVGSPADSLNSVVVNSVRRDGSPASYSRKGNVLSFFNKPDVSYYGGDYDERIIVFANGHEEEVFGTSFAAPWISRKLCYLIDVMGLPREVAKALLIDSAAGWDYKVSTYKNRELVGYGIVPIDVKDILTSQNNEIRFVVYGTSERYITKNIHIPVPRDENDKYPYIARATLCYFPKCLRTQGVDYTTRELSLTFGRVVDGKGTIKDINCNNQEQTGAYIDERQSRRNFRKWENTKFISALLKKNKPMKSYDEYLWGMAITSKERLSTITGNSLNFGVVVTLREISGINRVDEFVKACYLRGYIVNELDVQNRVNIYNSSQENIRLE